MIKDFYVIQKFQKICEALGLDLELLELKIEKSQHEQGGVFHIRTKPRAENGGYNIVQSFKDFKEFNIFLEIFQKKINKFAKYLINPELF